MNFDKLFNAFILCGMTVAMAIATYLTLSDSPDGHLYTLFAAFGSLMGVFSAVASANGKIITFLFGLIDVSIYAVMCFLGAKYGNAVLHVVYFVPMQFVGFAQWRSRKRRGEDGSTTVRARRLSPGMRWACLGIFMSVSTALYFILLQFDKSAAESFLRISVASDAVAVVCNVIGQLLMSTAFMEQWICWIAVNVFSIVMWSSSLVQGASSGGSYCIIYIIKYSFYLMNSINGLRIWLKLSRANTSTVN